MSTPFMGGPFGSRRGGRNDGWPGTAIWEAMEKLRGEFEQKTGPRMGRGDVRAAVSATALCGIPVLHAAAVGVQWLDLRRSLRLVSVSLAAARGVAAGPAGARGLPGSGSPLCRSPAHCAAEAAALSFQSVLRSKGQGC